LVVLIAENLVLEQAIVIVRTDDMNERIIELAEQSGLEYNFDPMLWLKYEKFAELIVRECFEICRSEDWEDQQGWGKLYAHKIKKHFGVE
jgi:hypothetical protein